MIAHRFTALTAAVLVASPAAAGEKLYHEHVGNTPEVTLPSLAPLVKQIKPAVVNINTSQRMRVGPMMGPGGDPFEQFFGQFFNGQAPQRELERQSLGSGFIVDEKGYVLTNNHVIEKADKIHVTMADGREFAAKLIGSDPKTDVALLKIESNQADFPYVNLGDSDAIEVGDWVVAIGNPFGLGLSVAHGLVSAKERSIGFGPYDDYIQSDALINPGNSGGPLFDLAGEVVGINAAINPKGQGIGFAVPINQAKQLLPQLVTGKIVRGWLGVSIQSLNADLSRSLNLTSTKGALVAQVVRGGPAEKAGLKSGDVVVKLNGQPIGTASELTRAVAVFAPGSKIAVEAIRDGQSKSFKVKIGERPDDSQMIAEGEEAPPGEASPADALGIAVRPLSGEQVQAMGLESGEGVIVASVRTDGPAAQAGVEPGDVVVEVNRHKIHSIGDYQKAIGNVRSGEMALLRLRRRQSSIYVAVKI
jgi:serine protease Do